MRGVTEKRGGLTTYWLFQLTRLMRGVTDGKSKLFFEFVNFNSHASCEA